MEAPVPNFRLLPGHLPTRVTGRAIVPDAEEPTRADLRAALRRSGEIRSPVATDLFRLLRRARAARSRLVATSRQYLRYPVRESPSYSSAVR